MITSLEVLMFIHTISLYFTKLRDVSGTALNLKLRLIVFKTNTVYTGIFTYKEWAFNVLLNS